MIGLRLWQIAGWTMLHYFWVGMALGAVMLLVRQRLRSTAASVRYWVAVGSLLLLSAVPVVIAVVVMQHFPTVPKNEPLPVNSTIRHDAIPVEPVRPVMIAVDMPSPVLSGNHPAAAVETSLQERLLATLNLAAMGLPWLWVLGTPLSFALTTAGLFGAERLRRQSRPLEDARITEMCRKLASSLKISYRVSVAVCDRIASPILVGMLRPMILLPAAALAGWDPQQLEMVLLHELAHVRRYDNLVNLLQRIVESLLFFQPFVWIISGWVRREREHCCDEFVVARTRQPYAYAEILMTLAETFARSPSHVSSPAVSSMAERPLVARIRHILKKEEQSMQVSRKAIALVLALILGISTIIGGYFSIPTRAEDPAMEPMNEKTSAAITPPPASAAVLAENPKPVAGKNYVVVPFTSELQRAMRASHKAATFFVLINGEPMLNEDDTKLDVGVVDFKGLEKALQDFIRARLLRRVIVEADVGRRDTSCKPGTASWVLLSWLHNAVPTDDFKAYLTHRNDKKDWQSVAADLSVPPSAEAIQREQGIGDDLVTVYPICTPLSRYFAGDKEDCVIRNIKSLDQLTPEEIEAIPMRAKAFAIKLGFKQPIKMRFVTDGGASLVKSNRAMIQLHLGGAHGDHEWWETQGFQYQGQSL